MAVPTSAATSTPSRVWSKVKEVLRCVEQPASALLGLLLDKPAAVTLRSGGVKAELTRRNVAGVIAACRLAKEGQIVLRGCSRQDARLVLPDGVERDVPLSVLRILHNLLRQNRAVPEKTEASALCLRLPKYGFALEGPFENVVWAADEVTSDFYYHDAEVRGAAVVDIGGNIGDSAQYFASRGASRIHVYEISPPLIEAARRNVARQPEVVLHEYGLGRRDQPARAGSAAIREINRELREVLAAEKRIGLLKMDCEGAEWELVPAIAPDVLERTEAVYIEVHGGDHEQLLSHLRKNGFEVAARRPLPWHSGVALYRLRRSRPGAKERREG